MVQAMEVRALLEEKLSSFEERLLLMVFLETGEVKSDLFPQSVRNSVEEACEILRSIPSGWLKEIALDAFGEK